VPVDVPSSETLLVVRTLSTDARPLSYLLNTENAERWFILNKATGELRLRGKVQQHLTEYTGIYIAQRNCIIVTATILDIIQH
jgi:hypothetical protein